MSGGANGAQRRLPTDPIAAHPKSATYSPVAVARPTTVSGALKHRTTNVAGNTGHDVKDIGSGIEDMAKSLWHQVFRGVESDGSASTTRSRGARLGTTWVGRSQRELRKKKSNVKAASAGVPYLDEVNRSPGKRAGILGMSGLGIGALARGGSAIAGAFLPIGGLFSLGWFLTLMLGTYGRYFSAEEARATREVQVWRALQIRRSTRTN